jgi:uncharacterized protein (TIGR02145 family)
MNGATVTNNTFTMNGNVTVTAVFETVSVTPGGDTFTDSRDGKTYRKVTIGSQTWMAENLNYETDSSWCYDNENSNCAKYGRLYTWYAAMSACPVGWRLPASEEWNTLVTFAGGAYTAGTKLKAKSSDWNGTDDYGFSALPGGYRLTYGHFLSLGSHGGWLAATDSHTYYRGMSTDNASVSVGSDDREGVGWSVRCVQDDIPKDSTTSDSFSHGGQTYKTVKIGNQTWMAENLNYQTSNSWCYNNDNSNCAKYGRLYAYDAALTACPAGWRLPASEDWQELGNSVGKPAGIKLKSGTPDWNGTNDYGFSALPGGSGRHPTISFSTLGQEGRWWAITTRVGATFAEESFVLMKEDNGYISQGNYDNDAFSVRCIKDD